MLQKVYKSILFVGSQLCFTDGRVSACAGGEAGVRGLALDHGEVLLLAAALPPPPHQPRPLQRQHNLRGGIELSTSLREVVQCPLYLCPQRSDW